MNVLISGSSGTIGRHLVRRCSSNGWNVSRLVRSNPSPGDVLWNPANGSIDRSLLAGTDIVIHLAGEPLANGRWTRARKRRILESRTRDTHRLADAIASLTQKPAAMLSASAIGYYGSRDDTLLDETTPRGDGFLADVCDLWERATQPAIDAGIRVAHLRIGLVLSTEGGALKSMLPAFRIGLGGRLGLGTQFMSWISLDDTIGAIEHLMQRNDLAGPFNLTALEPVTNDELARTLARRLHRHAMLPVPAAMLRIALGEFADEAVLASIRAVPRRLLESGFVFSHPTLFAALNSVLSER